MRRWNLSIGIWSFWVVGVRTRSGQKSSRELSKTCAWPGALERICRSENRFRKQGDFNEVSTKNTNLPIYLPKFYIYFKSYFYIFRWMSTAQCWSSRHGTIGMSGTLLHVWDVKPVLCPVQEVENLVRIVDNNKINKVVLVSYNVVSPQNITRRIRIFQVTTNLVDSIRHEVMKVRMRAIWQCRGF